MTKFSILLGIVAVIAGMSTSPSMAGPWRGFQGRFRNTLLHPLLPPISPARIQMAASNTIGPRGGGEVYIYTS
jgi:hypothetical protein